jgi:hypothetical protein
VEAKSIFKMIQVELKGAKRHLHVSKGVQVEQDERGNDSPRSVFQT